MVSNGNPFIDASLPNGLRVVMEPMPSVHSAAAGFLVNTGSRDETPDLAGVSHFLEHMCFKGTSRRTWHDVNVAFDEMGSYYNAFTGKERTFYFGWVPADRIDDQIELLADMMRSALPEDEFEVEKGVILEEIAMSKDSIEHLAWDLVHENLYRGHPLGWPILGIEQTIKSLTRDQMYAYFQRRYSPGNLVLIVAGRIDPDLIMNVVTRRCGDWPTVRLSPDRAVPSPHPGSLVKQLERFKQQAIGSVFPAPPAGHPDAEVARATASILGGDNSRFFWEIVQAGLSPHAGVSWNAYSDCGMMVLDGLCQPENAEAFTDAYRLEAEKISCEGVTQDELRRVKNKRRTSLAIESEAAYHRLMQIAEDICDHDRPRTVEERLIEVEAVTVDRVAKYLADWPIVNGGLFISLGPRRWPEVQSS